MQVDEWIEYECESCGGEYFEEQMAMDVGLCENCWVGGEGYIHMPYKLF